MVKLSGDMGLKYDREKVKKMEEDHWLHPLFFVWTCK